MRSTPSLSETLGYHPEIILSGRRINDGMGQYVASELVRIMIVHDTHVKKAKVLLLGLTFKENCPDIRNTRVKDIYDALIRYDIDIHVTDPHADKDQVKHEYNIDLFEWDNVSSTKKLIDQQFDAVVLTVSHNEFGEIDAKHLKESGCIIYDVKSFFPKDSVHARL